jgi:transcriptional regulator with XRE-family HTH domain
MMQDDLNWAIGTRIAQRRKIIGLSQRRLAELCGVSYQQVSKYEAGQVPVSAAMLLRIAGALDIPPAELIPAVTPTGGKVRRAFRR